MSDETRERYLKAVNIICEQFGLEKPSQIIYVCKAVDRLIKEEKDILDFPIDCNYVLYKTKEGNYESTFNCCKNFSLNELKTY